MPCFKNNSLSLDKGLVDDIEIRSGKITCGHCGADYEIEDGIIDFLSNANERVARERRAMDEDEYITDGDGNKYKITEETIEKFKDQFLALPEGDGTYFFKRGGSFQRSPKLQIGFTVL